jgi:hypothetical protein
MLNLLSPLHLFSPFAKYKNEFVIANGVGEVRNPSSIADPSTLLCSFKGVGASACPDP